VTGPTRRHRAEHIAFRIARSATTAAPEWLALAAGAAFGAALGSVLRLRRADVDRHLRWAFPDAAPPWRRDVARASYAHLGRQAAALLLASRWSAAEIQSRTRMIGFEPFRDAAAAGRGVVLLTGHHGNWEMGGAAIAAQGVPLDVVSKGMSNRLFEKDLFDARARLGMRVIEMGEAARDAPRSLAAGRVVALLGDQQAHRGGVLVPFFGRPASTARGPALFALRSGAAVFVAFCVAESGPTARYTVTFQALEQRPSADAEADVLAFLGRYGQALETAVRAAPEQYFWQHRRWKNAPGPDRGPESDGELGNPSEPRSDG
jgi:Kdo2-lipid IVA lauroyltransferase/acyltransferase